MRPAPRPRLRPVLLALAVLAGALPMTTGHAAEPEPVRLIFDTDMGNDIDDALALGLIHALESRGECRLLAVTLTKGNRWSAPFCDLVNTFTGRPDVPIGTVRRGPTPGEGNYTRKVASARDGARWRYPRDLEDGRQAPEATAVLRQTLAAQPDGSVVIVQVGFSTNLARLLASGPDEHSPLDGSALVARKVQLLSAMAGSPRFPEFNVARDIPAAQALAARWPTPIVYSPFEVGKAIRYPAASIQSDYDYLAHHPLKEAYQAYKKMPYDRETWDLTSVLHAVRPGWGYFTVSEPGTVTISDKGLLAFREHPDGRHRLLSVTPEQVTRARDAMVALCPQRPAAMTLYADRRCFALRDALQNCRLRFARDQQARVAFLGGSITWAEGWRPLVAQWLQQRFPEATLDFVNAGISSTDSTLGPFRLESTVFHRGPVDLLFVEFAVNDLHNERTATERLRGMEGIVRAARQRNPAVDIVLMYFADLPHVEAYQAGRTPPQIATHEQVARHYRLTAIDLAREVAERIQAGELTWKQFGGCHPSPRGHRLYADTIAHVLDAAWTGEEPKDGPRAHPLPAEPLDPLHTGRGRFLALEKATAVKGWTLVPKWNATDAHTRPRFRDVPMLVAEEAGAELRLSFQGTAVGLLVVAGPDVGVLEFRVDEGPWRQVDQFTQWSGGLHIPWAIVLDAELEKGEHVLRLRTAARKHPKSRGHACRIVQFLAN